VSEPPLPATLKANPNRSVFLEVSGTGIERVVKRYRAKGWLRRLWDRGRARGEFTTLIELQARGIAVPEPVELRRRGGAWEVVIERIPGALTLGELQDAPSRSPVPATVLAARLGELLARAHAAGLDHPDLHAGNILIDSQGIPWLIDFTHARVREASARHTMTRDMINLAADTRERVAPAIRKRFFIRWWRSLPTEARAALPRRGEFAEEIEKQARRHRREAVLAHGASWLRGFDHCREVRVRGVRGLVLGSVSSEEEAALVEALAASPPAPSVIPHPVNPDRELLVIDGGEESDRDWCELGRAVEHALPCLRPLLRLEGPPARAGFLLPSSSRRWSEVAERGKLDEGQVHGLAILLGALHDRGLVATDRRSWWVTPAGAVLLGPGIALEEQRGD
jgi:tRNA A-37 threonylcarbamoyl transferase component Bud32